MTCNNKNAHNIKEDNNIKENNAETHAIDAEAHAIDTEAHTIDVGHRSAAACWVEAMRLRTLPVSVAGVCAACACALLHNTFGAVQALLCLAFAVLAQIASNFANEYYDFRAGLDRCGRQGPRRGVTEGDITPRAMAIATYVVLACACVVGLCLVHWGGWWLIPTGLGIAIAALAYSAGPWPLSRHCLGEVAVIAFFGIIPVNLTYYVQAGVFDADVFRCSVAIGLMGANVLIVNNYRDSDDDRAVGKHTLAVVLGRRATSILYLLNGWCAVLLMSPIWAAIGSFAWAVPVAYAALHTLLWALLCVRCGARLNPMLGATAVLMLAYALGFIVVAVRC